MFKTFAKFDADKNRTVAITVAGKTRYITPDDKAVIINEWRCAGYAGFAPILGGQVSENLAREFELYESPDYTYVIHCHDGGMDHLQVVASNLALVDQTAPYRHNPRWAKMRWPC